VLDWQRTKLSSEAKPLTCSKGQDLYKLMQSFAILFMDVRANVLMDPMKLASGAKCEMCAEHPAVQETANLLLEHQKTNDIPTQQAATAELIALAIKMSAPAEPEAPAAGSFRARKLSKPVFTRAESDRILKKFDERSQKNLFQGSKEEDPAADAEAMAMLTGGGDLKAMLEKREAEAAIGAEVPQNINNPYKMKTGGGGSRAGGVADSLSRAQAYRSSSKKKILQDADSQFNASDVEGLVATTGREQAITDNVQERLQAKAREAEKGARDKAATDEAKKDLPNLLAMTEVERADVIDGLTRKAFALMEAGDVAEATTYLKRAAAVVAAFKNLEDTILEEVEDRGPLSWEEDLQKMQTEGQILTKLRRELHKDDFQGVFGGRYAQWIGGF